MATAQARFAKAHDLDPNFAEAQGSLAVIEALDGQRDAAERRIEVALRLDRQCFSAAYAAIILAAADGDQDSARRRAELAFRQPIDGQGRTLEQIIARMAR